MEAVWAVTAGVEIKVIALIMHVLLWLCLVIDSLLRCYLVVVLLIILMVMDMGLIRVEMEVVQKVAKVICMVMHCMLRWKILVLFLVVLENMKQDPVAVFGAGCQKLKLLLPGKMDGLIVF